MFLIFLRAPALLDADLRIFSPHEARDSPRANFGDHFYREHLRTTPLDRGTWGCHKSRDEWWTLMFSLCFVKTSLFFAQNNNVIWAEQGDLALAPARIVRSFCDFETFCKIWALFCVFSEGTSFLFRCFLLFVFILFFRFLSCRMRTVSWFLRFWIFVNFVESRNFVCCSLSWVFFCNFRFVILYFFVIFVVAFFLSRVLS